MKNQPIEAIALEQEPQPRNAKKLWWPIAAAALTLTAAAGLSRIEEGDNTEAKVEVVQAEPKVEQQRNEVQEVTARKVVRFQTQNIEQQYKAKAELYFNTVVWNNAVWFNEVNKIRYDSGLWDRLHECEQPGNWYANGYNSADPYHQLFQGGLGMSTEAWDMAVDAAAERGVNLPSSALDASIHQQKQGAQVFYEDHGWGWTCDVRLP